MKNSTIKDKPSYIKPLPPYLSLMKVLLNPGEILFHTLRTALLICLFFGGCSSISPKINLEYYPLSYDIDLENWEDKRLSLNNGDLLLINSDIQINDDIIRLWRRHQFYPLYKKRHPFQDYTERDLQLLRLFLNEKLDIYYWRPDNNAAFSITRDQVIDRLGREPLTNTELSFLMNASSDAAFSSKSYTILIVSSHELMARNGGVPVYPKVASDFLRQRLNLPPAPHLSSMNLFATKNDSTLYLPTNGGFIFCRKFDQTDEDF